MSGNLSSAVNEKGSKSVSVFYDSGDNDDARSTAGSDEEGFYDSHDLPRQQRLKGSDEEISRANSPDYPDDSQPSYAQLKHLKGLTSPLNKVSSQADDSVSLKESVVSSLSSHSEHNLDTSTTMRNNSKESESNEALSFLRDESSGSRKNQRKISFSLDSVGEISGQQSPDRPSTPKEHHRPAPKRVNLTARPEELSAFNYILSSEEDIGLGTHTRVTSTHRSSYKCEFTDKLKLVQTVAKAHTGPIWTMKFNHNGQFLATGGADSKVFIWCVAEIPKRPENKVTADNDVADGASGGVRDSGDFTGTTPPFAKQNQEVHNLNHLLVGPFLLNDPYRSLIGHDEEEDITDISWSRSGSEFLLTASTDRKVCLWNVHESQYIQYFRHNDVVTAVEFDPHHDRYFVSACFDHRIRVWDIIPHGSVKEFAKTKEATTALAFSPSGQVIAAGLLHGQVTFLQYDGMRYITQMDCKNRNGKFKNGAKVTGITYILPLTDDPNAPAATPANTNAGNSNNNPRNSADRRSMKADAEVNSVLISTNDHRIRLCTTDYRTHTKFKGAKNKSMQIKATVSEDNSYVICGSDTGAVFIWRLKRHLLSSGLKASRSFFFSSNTAERDSEYETFDGVDAGNTSSAGDVTGGSATNMTAVTCAIFAPALAMKRFLRAQSSIVPEQHTSKAGKQQRQSNSMDAFAHYDEDKLLTEFSTRIVVTADTEGVMRVFFRMI